MGRFFVLFLFIPSLSFAGPASSCDQGNSCDTVNGVETCRDHNKVIRRKIQLKDNLRNGLWECFDEKGVLIESKQFKNDKLNGLSRRYLPEIKKFEEVNYKDDDKHGETTVYQTSFSNGKDTLTGSVTTNFKEGKTHGWQIMKDAQGKETRRICWYEDQMQEEKPELCGGKKIVDNTPVNKEDPHKGWKTEKFKSGNIKIKYLLAGYQDYQEFYSYFENGTIRYSYRRKHKSKDFGADIYEHTELDDHGREIAKGECYVGATQGFYGDYCNYLTGTRMSYAKDGKLISKDNLVKGKQEGESWSLNGETEITSTYENDHLKRVIEKKAGKIIKDESYYEDGSIKKN